MTEVSTGTGGVSGMSGTGSTRTTAATRSADLGKQDFLKLLIAQLRNQDPMKPMEDRDFIAQMAQFSSLEAMQELNATMQRSANAQLIGQTSALVGKYVDAALSDGTLIGGVVDAVSFDTAEGVLTPRVQVQGLEFNLADVWRVTSPSTSAPAAEASDSATAESAPAADAP